jgi:hypothetical protein
MRTLRIEMNRGHGWELRATGKIPADVTVEQIQRDLREYAIQYPHRALIDGKEVARTGELPRRPWRARHSPHSWRAGTMTDAKGLLKNN